jgi:Pilus formation protein N terminal region
MTALCKRGLAALGSCSRRGSWLAIALFLAAAAASAARANEQIIVHLDEARVIKIPDRATTVVIGNPLIADISVQAGGLAVITGKSYGGTNIVIMDRSGAILTEHTVEVQESTDKIVIVYRGLNRATYSCTPQCAPRVSLGDETQYFSDTLGRVTARNGQSVAAGAGAPH